MKEALEGKAEVLTPDLPMHPDCHWRGVSGSYFLTYRIIGVKSQKVYKALNTDIRNDRKAVEKACCTCFNNGLLEETVNKTKTIKRSMYNRAKAEVLRAKLLYGNLKWDWNYHLN